MAFDDSTRGRLQRFVGFARGILGEEFTRQLQQIYGLDPTTGEVANIDELSHLDDQRLETARILRQVMDHYLATETSDGEAARITVLDRIVREQAFTILNRLAALRMMEARGILIESVGNGHLSKGFQLYQRMANGALGGTGETYHNFLLSLFDLFAVDLPGLFDRYAPQSRLFPREAALNEVLKEANHTDLEHLWAEDETIGWIYQYFNSKEERKAMRDASQAPRNSRELAVRNQFFTPRYVVEFLIDNTLGRLWFNWTGGQTGLRDRCQYLLVKPDENPEAAERLRDPRTIKLLDPACGSMHFGLYAFDLLLEVYREAWDWEQTYGPGSLDTETGEHAYLKPLCHTYADQSAFLHDVPRLIIECNIYGVDIDPRAAQIASLALWLRGQRAWHEADVRAKDRPQVGSGHVLAAVAPPAEVDLRKRFIEELDPLDAELFEKTLSLLKGLPELGVLLQIELELPALVRAVFGEHGGLFREGDMVQWQKAESRLRKALTDYARAAQSTLQGRLFAEDALQGLRMIDHCRELFDVVVMNPPFGSPSKSSKPYIQSNYFDSRQELYAAFIMRSSHLLIKGGRIGILSSRTGFFLPSMEEWRRKYLLGETQIEVAADLGLGVLDDALVEAACYIISSEIESSGYFIDCLSNTYKEDGLKEKLTQLSRDYYVVYNSLFNDLPYRTLSYWAPQSILELYKEHSSIENCSARVRIGLQTSDDFRFLRLSWETDPQDVGQDKTWISFAKGGEYQPFYDDIHLQVLWSDNGSEMKAFAIKHAAKTGSTAGNGPLREFSFYFKGGLTFPERTTSEFGVRALPDGCMTGTVGPGIHLDTHEDRLFLLGWLNTRIIRALIELSIGRGDAVHSGSAARHYNIRMVGGLPFLNLSDTLKSDVVKSVEKCVNNVAVKSSFDETTNNFLIPDCSEFESVFDFCLSLFTFIEDLSLEIISEQSEFEELFIEACGSSELIRQRIDCFVGVSTCEFEHDEIDADQLRNCYDLSIDALVDEVAKEKGQSRQISKKSFFGDRRIELIALLMDAHPASVVSARKKLGISPPGFVNDTCKKLVSIAVGIAFDRYDVENKIPLNRQRGITNYFEEPRFLGSSTRKFLKKGSDTIFCSDAGSPFDLGTKVSQCIELIFKKDGGETVDELCKELGVSDIDQFLNSPRGFFEYHLRTFSKSRRKAPIYWPITTRSNGYTIWLYYPSLTDQALYTAINDFIEPKINQVGQDIVSLRNKGGARSREDEKNFEALEAFEVELVELRDTLLEIAPNYLPNQNDGVLITAAPLWQIFNHKPWQKALKDTWSKLEKGDYDWAHLAMAYWPDRVREKCRTDKSLAIAHDLENIYEPPPEKPGARIGQRSKTR